MSQNLEIDLLRKLRAAAQRLQKAMVEFADDPGAWEEHLVALDRSITALEQYFPADAVCDRCHGTGFALDINPYGGAAKAFACPRGCMRRKA